MSVITKIVLAIILTISIGFNIYQYYNNNQQSTVVTQLKSANKQISKNNASQLRNDLDTMARSFLTAMKNKNQNTMKEYVAENITVTSKGLVINDLELKKKFDYPYPKIIGSFKQTYCLTQNGKYIVNYGSILENGSNIYFELVFGEVDGQWKIEKIGNDT